MNPKFSLLLLVVAAGCKPTSDGDADTDVTPFECEVAEVTLPGENFFTTTRVLEGLGGRGPPAVDGELAGRSSPP